jgi:UDP-N-acetylmuramoyl-tripeptide--D-alanyl-D-alanine ligase
MEAALNVLKKKQGRRIAVLGDMLELGASADPEHYRIGGIAAECADLLFVFGPLSGRVRDGAISAGMAEDKIHIYDSRDVMAQEMKARAMPGDVLLFKGSHGMHLELVLAAFLKEEK